MTGRIEVGPRSGGGLLRSVLIVIDGEVVHDDVIAVDTHRMQSLLRRFGVELAAPFTVQPSGASCAPLESR